MCLGVTAKEAQKTSSDLSGPPFWIACNRRVAPRGFRGKWLLRPLVRETLERAVAVLERELKLGTASLFFTTNFTTPKLTRAYRSQ